jgi:hypothetical protein
MTSATPTDRRTSDEFKALLHDSPAWFPLSYDLSADAVGFFKTNRDEIEAASFLDSRMAGPRPMDAVISFADVDRAATGLFESCHFVFHISHVGSTLMSRLIGLHPQLFSLREPAVLRTLADAQLALAHPQCPWTPAEFVRRAGIFLGLFSRTFEPGQTAVIKATSFVGELAELLLGRVTTARAVLMAVPLRTFLPALLGGAYSDVSRAARKRLFRLHRRLDGPRWNLEDFSPGELVAMTWLCEMLSLAAAAGQFPDRCRWVDFDAFLSEPGPGLAAVFRHLGVPDDRAAHIVASPTMGQYAKAPSQTFDADFRNRLLRQAERDHAREIDRGLAWLDTALSHSSVARLIDVVNIPSLIGRSVSAKRMSQ